MIDAVFNWQNYFLINLSFVISLICLKPLLNFIKLSQQSLLHYLRRFLLAHVAFFILIPIAFCFKPQPKLVYVVSTLPANTNSFSYFIFFVLAFLLGFIFATLNYLFKFYQLYKIIHTSIPYKKIKRINLIITDTQSLFCFTLFYQHYIAIPSTYLERSDLSLCIRHELQHLRQHDTYWLQFFSILRIVFYWNPCVHAFVKWCCELQEFACDEAIVLNKKNSLSAYAACLLAAAKHKVQQDFVVVLAMNGSSSSIIYRRLNMLFDYQPIKKTFLKSFIYGISFLGIATSAYAASSLNKPLTQTEVAKLIRPSYASTMHISAQPEVVKELNRIRTNPKSLNSMRASLQRMETYKPVIQEEILTRHVPNDLFAMPIVQSGFKPLPESANPVKAAGIWQIIPSTAKNLGLTVSATKDDRLDTKLSTQAALDYLQTLYKQFKDWKLAVVAYEMGENKTEELIKQSNSRNAWEIARASTLPDKPKKALLNYMANFDATVIILHNPKILGT